MPERMPDETWWRGDAQPWGAHGWTLELRGDELAEIRHDGVMLLRAVRAAVRDHGWLTVPAAIRTLETDADTLTLTLTLQHTGLGADISSRLRVTARPGEFVIEWDAVNGPTFDTCRVGLVALHPATDAGRPVTVEHPDGTVEPAAFPSAISPHQPIMGIRELRFGDGSAIRFEGDVFEMEDQRNWSDASFKTYSRPLAMPYPYRVEAGAIVRQSIAIRHTGAAPVAGPDGVAAAIALRAEGVAFPALGVEATTVPDPVEASAVGMFRVVQLDLTTPNWRAALERAREDGLPLDVRLITDGDILILADAVRALNEMDVLRIAAFDAVEHISSAVTVETLRAALIDSGVNAPVIGGTRSHFTELNREQHRIPRDVDGIAHTTTPLFHTLDTEQLVEALQMQRLIAEQAVRIADGLPVHIGPVSLRPRFNNVATMPEAAPTRDDLRDGYGSQFTGGVDERQRAPELAAWLIASAAALAVPGVASLSWFETVGPRGVIGAPAAEALEALLALEGELLGGPSPDGLVWAVGARGTHADVVLVANLDRTERAVTVGIADGGTHEARLAPATWTRLALSR